MEMGNGWPGRGGSAEGAERAEVLSPVFAQFKVGVTHHASD